MLQLDAGEDADRRRMPSPGRSRRARAPPRRTPGTAAAAGRSARPRAALKPKNAASNRSTSSSDAAGLDVGRVARAARGSTPGRRAAPSSVKKRIDSTPSRRLRQNCSTSAAPGKRPAMPMIAIASGVPAGRRCRRGRPRRRAPACDRRRCRARQVRAARALTRRMGPGRVQDRRTRDAAAELLDSRRAGSATAARERVAAEVEEVVVDADRSTPSTSRQMPATIVSSSASAAPRTAAASSGRSRLGGGQRPAVDLAVRRQRQRVERARRPPGACSSGSRSRRKRAQLLGGRRAPPASARRRRPAAGRRARPRGRPRPPRARRGARRSAASTSPSSTRKPRILTWWSRRPRNSRLPSARGAGQVAGPVQPRARSRAERVGDEPLGGQRRAGRGSRGPGPRRRCTARPRRRPAPAGRSGRARRPSCSRSAGRSAAARRRAAHSAIGRADRRPRSARRR